MATGELFLAQAAHAAGMNEAIQFVRRVHDVCNTKTYLSKPLVKHAFCERSEQICKLVYFEPDLPIRRIVGTKFVGRISLSAELLERS